MRVTTPFSLNPGRIVVKLYPPASWYPVAHSWSTSLHNRLSTKALFFFFGKDIPIVHAPHKEKEDRFLKFDGGD